MIPKTKKYASKTPLGIIEGVKKLLNEKVFPSIKEDTGIDIFLRVNAEDNVRISKD